MWLWDTNPAASLLVGRKVNMESNLVREWQKNRLLFAIKILDEERGRKHIFVTIVIAIFARTVARGICSSCRLYRYILLFDIQELER